MLEQHRQFPHISLQLTREGSVPSGRPPRRSNRSDSNLNNRRGHGTQMQNSAETITSNWKSTLEERLKEGLPDIPNVPSLLIQVDPQSFDIDTLKSFDIEVILELEDGFILGASADSDLTKLQQKIQQFINEQRGGGKVAEIWEVLEGRFNRLEYILSPDLFACWDKLLEDHLYIVEVSIACVGLNPKFSKYPEREVQEDSQRYASRVARWTDKRDKTQQEWDNLQLKRENSFEDFVNEYNGTLLDIIHADNRHNSALLPDSFSCRIEISGTGLKDIANNYPYAFDICEPEQVSKSLSDQHTTGIEEPPFILEAPSPTAPKVCIIDSGIQESHRLLRAAIDTANSRSWVPGEIDQTTDLVAGGGHGTRVAGAALYPQTIPRTGNQAALCWIQNARVLDRNCRFPDKLYIPKVLNQIVDDYHVQKGTRIFNHSITGSSPCRRIYMSAWATALDHLSWKNDILFIVAAGNLPRLRGTGLSITRKAISEHFQAGRTYPDYLLQDSSRIANPAQSFQVLTVGSVAHCTYNHPPLTSLAKAGYPSSFSCTGYGIWNLIKPEVVEYGGDFVQDSGSPPSFSTPSEVCVELVSATLGGAPGIAADIGTSFSTPKISHIAAALANNFPSASCLLYRALIVQSARLPSWTNESRLNLSNALRMMGYGLPNIDRALGNTPNRITLITEQDASISAKQVHVYQVQIPTELQSPSNEFDFLVEITLSYKAEPRRTRRNRRKYLSTWLDWECSKRGESSDSFLSRVLMEYEASEGAEEGEGLFRWAIGQRKNWGRVSDTSRSIGTLQKDWAIVKSFDLRESFCIAVVGHRGWSNDPTAQVPYSLVVSFEAVNTEIPIYTSFVQAQVSLDVHQRVQVTV